MEIVLAQLLGNHKGSSYEKTNLKWIVSNEMKKTAEALSESALNLYPIKDVADGWHFSIDEISAGAYQVKGINKWGNLISRTCSENELDETLKLCANDAHEIDKQLEDNNL